MLSPTHKKIEVIFYCIVFLLTIPSPESWCIGNYHAGARSLALSNACISFTGTWAVFHNQAGLSSLNTISAGLYYDSKFSINKLATVAGSFILPVNKGVFGLSLLQFGKGTFHENKFGIAFARSITEKLSLGIQMDYISSHFPENTGSKGFATFEGGFIYSPEENLFIGLHIFNPLKEGLKMPGGEITMPVIIRTGCHYILGENVLISFEGEKENLSPLTLKTGLEFCPVDRLALRIGASGSPFKYTSGIGYKMNSYSADISFVYHENLGITPALSFQIQL